MTWDLYCCGCGGKTRARLTDGSEVYPRRPDLGQLPFWKCDQCGNYVGCHHRSHDRTRPLGCIPDPAMRNARSHIHALIDPAWQAGVIRREDLYHHLSEATGRKYHTANLRTIEEARRVYAIARDFIRAAHKATTT